MELTVQLFLEGMLPHFAALELPEGMTISLHRLDGHEIIYMLVCHQGVTREIFVSSPPYQSAEIQEVAELFTAEYVVNAFNDPLGSFEPGSIAHDAVASSQTMDLLVHFAPEIHQQLLDDPETPASLKRLIKDNDEGE